MTAEDLLKTYYSIKDVHDSQEAELEGKPPAVRSYDEIYEQEKARMENIRAHRNDMKYAQELLQKEFDRGDRIADRQREQKRIADNDRQRQYERNAADEARRLDAFHRREDERRREEERRQEEYDRRRYEEECRRREEEDYRRRRQAEEEYYAQLRDRNR